MNASEAITVHLAPIYDVLQCRCFHRCWNDLSPVGIFAWPVLKILSAPLRLKQRFRALHLHMAFLGFFESLPISPVMPIFAARRIHGPESPFHLNARTCALKSMITKKREIRNSINFYDVKNYTIRNIIHKHKFDWIEIKRHKKARKNRNIMPLS